MVKFKEEKTESRGCPYSRPQSTDSSEQNGQVSGGGTQTESRPDGDGEIPSNPVSAIANMFSELSNLMTELAKQSDSMASDPHKPWCDSSPHCQRKWKQRIKLPYRNFLPGEVDARVTKGKIVIKAVHVEGDEENNEKYELNRKVDVPTDVDISHISCTIRYSYLFIEAPYKTETPAVKDSSEADTKKEETDKDKCAETKATPQEGPSTSFPEIRPVVLKEKYVIEEKDSDSDGKNQTELSNGCNQAKEEKKPEEDPKSEDKFVATFDLTRFRACDVSINRTLKGLEILAKSVRQSGTEEVTESFEDECVFPPNVDRKSVRCMNEEGILTVTAPYLSDDEQREPLDV